MLLALGLLGEDLALLGEHRSRHIAAHHIARIGRGHVHRQIAGQRLVAALEGDEHADARAVHVGAERARRLDHARSGAR